MADKSQTDQRMYFQYASAGTLVEPIACMRGFVPLLACILVVATSTAAMAQPSAPQGESDTVEVTENYAYQIFLADVANIALTGGHKNSGVLLLTFVSVGPAVHLYHENRGTAAGSFALRTLLPLAGGYIGGRAEGCSLFDDELCYFSPRALLGIAAGGTLAMLIDYGLATKTRRQQRAPSMIQLGSLRANPNLGLDKRGSVRFGLHGSW